MWRIGFYITVTIWSVVVFAIIAVLFPIRSATEFNSEAMIAVGIGFGIAIVRFLSMRRK